MYLPVNRHARHQAVKVGAACPAVVPPLALGRWRAGAHLEAVAVALHHRLHPGFPCPALLLRMKVLASGTSTWLKAGLGLLTVRAHSQAITVSCWPGCRPARPAFFRFSSFFGQFPAWNGHCS
jgi:hypothetical protein